MNRRINSKLYINGKQYPCFQLTDEISSLKERSVFIVSEDYKKEMESSGLFVFNKNSVSNTEDVYFFFKSSDNVSVDDIISTYQPYSLEIA